MRIQSINDLQWSIFDTASAEISVAVVVVVDLPHTHEDEHKSARSANRRRMS